MMSQFTAVPATWRAGSTAKRRIAPTAIKIIDVEFPHQHLLSLGNTRQWQGENLSATGHRYSPIQPAAVVGFGA